MFVQVQRGQLSAFDHSAQDGLEIVRHGGELTGQLQAFGIADVGGLEGPVRQLVQALDGLQIGRVLQHQARVQAKVGDLLVCQLLTLNRTHSRMSRSAILSIEYASNSRDGLSSPMLSQRR